MDPASLQRALTAEPRAEAVVASAAGFTAHSARTKGDNSRTDTEGYRNLVDAAKNAGVPRVVLISILECDKASEVPHFPSKVRRPSNTWPRNASRTSPCAPGPSSTEPGTWWPQRFGKESSPRLSPELPMSMIYSPDLARYAAQAALDVPASALNQSVDVCWDVPATGPLLAAAFTRALGRPVVAKPAFPPLLFAVMPLLARFVPPLRDMIAVLAWIRKGGYVSRETQKQKDLFGELPTIEEAVARYCRDKGLVKPTAS